MLLTKVIENVAENCFSKKCLDILDFSKGSKILEILIHGATVYAEVNYLFLSKMNK